MFDLCLAEVEWPVLSLQGDDDDDEEDYEDDEDEDGKKAAGKRGSLI